MIYPDAGRKAAARRTAGYPCRQNGSLLANPHVTAATTDYLYQPWGAAWKETMNGLNGTRLSPPGSPARAIRGRRGGFVW